MKRQIIFIEIVDEADVHKVLQLLESHEYIDQEVHQYCYQSKTIALKLSLSAEQEDAEEIAIVIEQLLNVYKVDFHSIENTEEEKDD